MNNFWENENFFDFQRWYLSNHVCTPERIIKINESPYKYKKEYWDFYLNRKRKAEEIT